MIELPLTFMIPVKIDTPDRIRNFRVVTSHLLHNYDCPIIITEADTESKLKGLIPDDSRVTYRFIRLEENDPFHRTKYLNEMTAMSKTMCVANYDIDVMFNPQSIAEAVRLIVEDGADVVYPFGEMEMDQYQFRIKDDVSPDQLLESNFHHTPQTALDSGFVDTVVNWTTFGGHCMIFNIDSYFDGFLENEEFVSWGPEDAERHYRFRTLGFDLRHMSGNKVCHLEHATSVDSGRENPFLPKNESLWAEIQNITGTYLPSNDEGIPDPLDIGKPVESNALREYYESNFDYYKKYERPKVES